VAIRDNSDSSHSVTSDNFMTMEDLNHKKK